MKPVYRWLGTFKDPDMAEMCVRINAKRLKQLKLTGQYSVGIRTEVDGHHVNLYKRDE